MSPLTGLSSPLHPSPPQTVYRGRWANTPVAIVRMRKGGTVTEARMMQQLSGHPNLVQFYRCVLGGLPRVALYSTVHTQAQPTS